MSDTLESVTILDTDSQHVIACTRHPAEKLRHVLPVKFFEALEHNQQIATCCRHPENHDIEAFYSNAQERWRDKDPARDMPNPPDIYIMHCTCGRQHRRFCVGSGERPFWEAR
jgi:hypothetical protein